MKRNLLSWLIGGLIFNCAPLVQAQETRDIIPVFESVRPPVSVAAGSNGGSGNPTNSASGRDKNKPVYQRVNSRINSGKISNSDRPKPSARAGKKPPAPISVRNARQIGVTIWKLEEISTETADAEVFAETGARKRLLMPQRVSTESIFATNDLVRMSFEASRRGYLYIINQEMSADGTLGEANLIFPSKRIRNSANLINIGQPIELPDAKGNPFYFELRPQNGDGKRLSAEVLTVIITDRPILDLKIGERPLPVDSATLEKWRAKWAGNVEIFEPKNPVARYTKGERDAAGGKSRLTRRDALPNTVFLVEGNKSGGSMITIPLWYEN